MGAVTQTDEFTLASYGRALLSSSMGADEFLRRLRDGELPNQPVVVKGDLQLDDSDDLTRLPVGLHVDGKLKLWGCKTLTALPERLRVGGGLDLRGCTLLRELSRELHVGGDLNLWDCTSLRELPAGLHAGGNLDLSFCRSLAALPVELHVSGNLNLWGCVSLTTLPTRLYVDGDLNLTNCTSLTALPEGLRVGGNLGLSRCTSLTTLPVELHVGGNLDLEGCRSLTALPEGLHVGGGLYLLDCTLLTALPEGLRVGGNLDLSFSTSLIALPTGLHVGGNLDLEGCRSLTALPEGLRVGGNLNLSDCIALTALPNDINQWGLRADGETCVVNLTGTGLSDALIDRLMATPAPGMRFHFSRQEAPVVDAFATLDEAVKFWRALLPQGEVAAISLNLRLDHRTDLLHFLTRLKATEEYQNRAARSALAKRIYDVLQGMQGEEEFKETANLIIHEGLTTCHDRIISALDELDLMIQIKKAERQGGREELRKLGRGMQMLEEVKKAATAHALTLTWVDEIEVQLAFQIVLQGSLQLPLSTGHMIFRRCAHISDEKIREAGADIERRITDTEVEAYLRTWGPWQKMLRREAFQALHPENVKAPDDIEWVCCIGGEDLAEGTLYGGHLYSLNALMKIYVESGFDPFTRDTIDLAHVKKVARRDSESIRLTRPPLLLAFDG